MTLQERLSTGVPLIFDGAMGTLLFTRAPHHAGPYETLNLEKPEIIEEVHRLYVEAGAGMIETNTFGGSLLKLEEFNAAHHCHDINARGAEAARKAAGDSVLVGGSMGPTGRLVEPMGETPAEIVYDSYVAQVKGLVAGGVDLIVIETMNDLQEARLALLAARDTCELPVVCSMTFEENGKTFSGTDMVTGLGTLAQMGAAVVGANCSMGPDGLVRIFKENIEGLATLGVPLSVWSNAGLPRMEEGKAVYDLTPEDFAATSEEFAKMGVALIGGCCGTTPDHIHALQQRLHSREYETRQWTRAHRYVTSRLAKVDLEEERELLVIGERLNPTARKKFAEDLKKDTQVFLRLESKKQVTEGAHILDLNVGVPTIDEVAAMHRSILTLSNLVSTPLMLDSDNPAVLEKGLLTYPGVPIVNSINGKDSSIEKIMPLLQRFGAFTVALCLDESGIHIDAEKRIAIGDRLISILDEHGIDPQRVIIDPLMLAESAEPGAAMETLKVIAHYHTKGIKTSLGVSNISFGLPQRKNINNVFLRMAVDAGLTAGIVNPATMYVPHEFDDGELLAADFLKGNDPGAARYIDFFRDIEEGPQKKSTQSEDLTPMQKVYYDVLEGNSDEVAAHVEEALKDHDAKAIMDDGLLKALEKTGEYYSTGEYFLPQMIASANAMKKGFAILKPILSQKAGSSLGKVLICTVKGDVHDIGKNIVAMMMENHGFEVHDLGKDVDTSEIVLKTREMQPDIVCLSSLLTTTMTEMKTVKERFDEEGLTVPVMVGGAVVTDEYAQSIGAHYSDDAVSAVNLAKKLMAS